MTNIDHSATVASITEKNYSTRVDQKTADRSTIERSGKFKGQNVTWQPSATSMIEDGAEEVGSFIGQRLADKLKKKERKKRGGVQLQNLVKKSGEFHRAKVPDLNSNKELNKFYLELVEENEPTKEFIMKTAAKAFTDRTLQNAGLNFAKDVLGQQDGHHRLKGAIESAIKELKKEHGPEIDGGTTISANAGVFSRKHQLGEVGALRACYLELVFMPDTIGKAYETIIKHLKKEEINFKVMFEFLRSSAVVELNVAGSATSVSKSRLRQCINDMERLKLLSALYGRVGGILQGFKKNYRLGKNTSLPKFFGNMLQMFSKPIYASKVLEQLTMMLQIQQVAPFIYLLHNMSRLVRSAHLRSFSKRTDRASLLAFFEKQIDQAVMRE